MCPAVPVPAPQIRVVDAALGSELRSASVEIISGPRGAVTGTLNTSGLSHRMSGDAGSWLLRITTAGYTQLATTVVTVARGKVSCGEHSGDPDQLKLRLRPP